ncbi:MAG TPA: S8 family serine peptidase [Gemmatimonadaceae bacterium]|nr:S8 family serine peptidase [Gemmatimonadaceae bacterium]
MKRNLALALVAAFAVAACSEMSEPTNPSATPNVSYSAASDNADVIPGRFIITLRDGVDPSTVAAEHGARPDFVYHAVLNGFAGDISEAARSGLMRDARVLRIEPDGIARASATQYNATWGIDRVDQGSLPLSGTYSYTATGNGVTAYIIDTGIETGHAQFGSRASVGYDSFNGNGQDCNGHGTHVAGTVGGTTYGIAKNVSLKAVRVLDCNGSGSWSGVIAGMNWVVQNHAAGTTPAVANMSLGGGANSSVDAAVNNMINAGVATAVAAGNGNWIGIAQDACKSSPARVANAMTIGATNSSDAKASWSNYGKCVDWFAPGVSITSAWTGSGTKTISGTSMAAPHTAGVAALYLSVAGNGSASSQTVRDALYDRTSRNIVKSSKSTNAHLLFSNF